MSTIDDADAWWHSQTEQRRLTIYGWLCNATNGTEPIDGQLAMPFSTDPDRKEPKP